MDPNIKLTDVEKAMAATKLTKFSVETDGTGKGTKILLNGKPIENLTSLNIGCYPESSYQPISLSFTVRDPNPQPGEFYSYTNYSYRCPCATPAYASNNRATASVDGGFEVKKGMTDVLGRSNETDLRKAYKSL